MWRYIRLNKKLPESKLGWALNTADRRVSCTNKRGLRITRNNQLWQIRYITRVVETRKNNKGRLADGIRQRTGRDNLDRYHSWRNLITLLDLCVSSPHCLPINHHKNQLDMVVGITWSSQHRHLNRLGMSICSPKTRIILIGMCGWYLNGWKEALEEMNEIGWSGRADIISSPRVRGMQSTWMQIETKVSLMSAEKCSNHESLPEQLKSHVAGKNHTRIRLVIPYGRTREEMRGTFFARMGNNTQRVQVRCAQWMMRAIFSWSDLWEECHCRVYCNRLWCDQLCNNTTRVQEARLLASRGCVRFARRPSLHWEKFTNLPSLWISGSNNSSQCSSNPETMQFPHRRMSNPSSLPICPELLVAHVLSSCLPRFPAYRACSSRWDQACSTVEPTLSAPPSVLLYALDQDVVWWPWRCCCPSKLRFWTFVLSGAPANVSRTELQDSLSWSPWPLTQLRIVTLLPVSLTNDVMWSTGQLPLLLQTLSTLSLDPREIQHTSLASFEVTRDSLQLCLWGCGRSRCLS